MICIEVRTFSFILEDIFAACIDYWFSKAFCKSSLPICTSVLMRKVCNQKPTLADFNTQVIINKSSRLTFINTFQIKSGCSHSNFEMVFIYPIKFRIPELHCHKRNPAGRFTTLQLFKLLPTRKRQSLTIKNNSTIYCVRTTTRQ